MTDPSSVAAMAADLPPPRLPPASFRILVAEDDAGLRSVLSKALRREGYQVSEADDGHRLVELIRAWQPDLILLDIMLPNRDGLSVLTDLRKDPKLASIYVILVTGRASLEEKIEGFETGADDYLTKPVQMRELKARVKAGVRIRALHRNIENFYQMMIRKEKLATVGALAAGVAHEFNNIMSGISGYAQLAKVNDKFKDRLIEVALTQSERVQRITSSLSTFSSSAASGKQFTSVRRLVDAAVCLMQKEMNRREVVLEVEASEQLPAIEVNFSQMQQAIVNLLLNAAQASRKAGRVAVRATVIDRCLSIEVDDSGPGVPEDHRHRIFDPFFTTKGALGGTEESGTGLGLTFALNIAQCHAGSIDLVESRLGGACFRLSIPLADSAGGAAPRPLGAAGTHGPAAVPGAAAAGAAAAADPRAHATGPRVLVVEDDANIQEIMREVLSDPPPICFAEGPAALEHCRSEEIDIVLVDLHLKGPWNGRRVLTELACLPSPPAVIVATGSIDPKSVQDLALAPAAILRKPFKIAELEAAIQQAASSTAR
ncbi:MAG: response regulator [Planctomycetes bacterium]|nr:response regulator [Planctomycetota bacterium]